MDISIVEKLECNILEDGATTINAQILYDIVRKLDDNSDVEIISNDGLFSLFGRGLKIKIISNGIQGSLFAVLWKYIEKELSNKVT